MKKVIAIYSLLALAVITPLLGRGYILTLDMIFTPVLRMPESISSSYLFHTGLHILNLAIPSDIIQKILLFAILILSGVGMHLLVRSTRKDLDYREMGAYFAGLFYMINPFTYDRLMAGQYAVLLGYALLPFFVRSLLAFLQNPGLRPVLVMTVWAIAISVVSIHTVGPLIILSIICSCAALWQRRRSQGYLTSYAKFAGLACALFIAASSYWLVPLALGKGNTAAEISRYSSSDAAAFATIGESPLAKISNVIRLQGFWAESRGLYTLPQDQVPVWGLLALMLWAVIITGAVSLWRSRQRYLIAIFGTSIVVGIILATGIFNSALENLVSLFAGYREPAKFIGLVALGYCVFAAAGVAAIIRYSKEQLESVVAAKVTAGVLLLLPVVFTSTMFWGANGQLESRNYPADWFAANTYLNRDKDTFQVLFLPWHLYLHFDFAERIIANPAPSFFDMPVIVSDDPEFKGAARAKSTAEKQQIGRILDSPEKQDQVGADLAALGIKYILLAKETDYEDYDYLRSQSGIRLVSETDILYIYQVEAFKKGIR